MDENEDEDLMVEGRMYGAWVIISAVNKESTIAGHGQRQTTEDLTPLLNGNLAVGCPDTAIGPLPPQLVDLTRRLLGLARVILDGRVGDVRLGRQVQVVVLAVRALLVQVGCARVRQNGLRLQQLADARHAVDAGRGLLVALVVNKLAQRRQSEGVARLGPAHVVGRLNRSRRRHVAVAAVGLPAVVGGRRAEGVAVW